MGSLEAVLDQAAIEDGFSDFIAVCCHPHPQHGGAMGNKVIYTAARSLAGLGIPSLRFNFRGVGQSEGDYDQGEGEQQDLVAAVAWMRQQFPDKSLILAGFSFGAYISACQARALNSDCLISIAPPVGRMDFSDIKQAAKHWLIIQGDEDELVEVEAVKNWVDSLQQAADLVIFEQATHFFHGRLLDLRQSIESYVTKHLLSPGILKPND